MMNYFKCAYCGIQFALARGISTPSGMFCSQTHRILADTESNVNNVDQHIRDMERAAQAERR